MANMTPEQQAYLIRTELNADLVGTLLGDDYFIEKLAQRDASLVKKIFNHLKGLNKKSPSVDRESARYLSKLVNKFGKAIDKSQGGVKISQLGREDEEKQGEVDSIRYSKMNNESLASNVDNVLKMSDEEALKNKEEGNFVSVMKRTPDVILQNVIEAENHEMIMRFDAFYLAVRNDGVLEGHYHNMGEFMKDLPQKLSNPLAILKMDNGRINVFAEFSSGKNKNGIASVELNTVKDINSKYKKYNLVVSVFSAKDNYIRNNIDKHGAEVEYKKEDLSQVNPQLYEWLAIINDKSSNSSISENSEKINTFDKKIDDERKSISKSERFTPGRHTEMQIAEELVNSYDNDTLSADDALRKLNVLGYKTGITVDNVLETLRELIPEIREFATSEREAYRESNRKDTAKFIESVSKMNDKSQLSKRKKKIGTLSREHAEIVTNLMKNELPGFSADGYELWIDGTGAKHIEDRHGVNGSADNSMATTEAKELISWAAQNAEKGYFIKENNGEIKRSKRFFNSDGSRAPEIRLEKQIDGDTVCVSECVPDSSNRRIWITSAYIKKGSKGQLLNMDEKSSPQPTPEASFDSTATNTIIPEKSQKSNSEQKKSKLTSKKAIKSIVLDVADIFSQTSENGEDIAFLPKEAETNIVTAIWKKVNAKGVYNMKNFANRMSKQLMQNIVLGDGNIYKVNTTLKSIMHRID